MAGTVFVYDDDCGFCTWWAEFFAARTDLQIVGFTELDSSLRAQLPAEFERCSHVVTDERVYSCGASIEEAFLRTGAGSVIRPLVERLRRASAYRSFREWAYRRGADNRDRLGRLLSKTPPARTKSEDP